MFKKQQQLWLLCVILSLSLNVGHGSPSSEELADLKGMEQQGDWIGVFEEEEEEKASKAANYPAGGIFLRGRSQSSKMQKSISGYGKFERMPLQGNNGGGPILENLGGVFSDISASAAAAAAGGGGGAPETGMAGSIHGYQAFHGIDESPAAAAAVTVDSSAVNNGDQSLPQGRAPMGNDTNSTASYSGTVDIGDVNSDASNENENGGEGNNNNNNNNNNNENPRNSNDNAGFLHGLGGIFTAATPNSGGDANNNGGFLHGLGGRFDAVPQASNGDSDGNIHGYGVFDRLPGG